MITITLTSILIGDIGEPPNIAKTNGEAERREEELAMVAPGLPLLSSHPEQL